MFTPILEGKNISIAPDASIDTETITSEAERTLLNCFSIICISKYR